MSTKVRKQIYLEADQERWLKRLSRETGASEAEIIRDALQRHGREATGARRDLDAWEAEKAFIARWIAEGAVAAVGTRQWRREELHER